MNNNVTVAENNESNQPAMTATGYDLMNQLESERLPGSAKTKWAMKYKMSFDQQIMDALEEEDLSIDRSQTKGRFRVETHTNAGQWVNDREWTYMANKGLKSAEKDR